jgi:hypothetical protein
MILTKLHEVKHGGFVSNRGGRSCPSPTYLHRSNYALCEQGSGKRRAADSVRHSDTIAASIFADDIGEDIIQLFGRDSLFRNTSNSIVHHLVFHGSKPFISLDGLRYLCVRLAVTGCMCGQAGVNPNACYKECSTLGVFRLHPNE